MKKLGSDLLKLVGALLATCPNTGSTAIRQPSDKVHFLRLLPAKATLKYEWTMGKNIFGEKVIVKFDYRKSPGESSVSITNLSNILFGKKEPLPPYAPLTSAIDRLGVLEKLEFSSTGTQIVSADTTHYWTFSLLQATTGDWVGMGDKVSFAWKQPGGFPNAVGNGSVVSIDKAKDEVSVDWKIVETIEKSPGYAESLDVRSTYRISDCVLKKSEGLLYLTPTLYTRIKFVLIK